MAPRGSRRTFRRASAPHLSPRERAALDKLTLARLRAIAPVPAPDAPAKVERAPWHFSAHLSPREQRVFRALQTVRRKAVVRAMLCADTLTRAALARALRTLRGVSRGQARTAPIAYMRARFARARALRRERAADRKAGAVAGQRARFHAFGSLTLRERDTGKRIGRAIARELAPASGAESFDATGESAPFILDAREGSGRIVEAQGVREMQLAARAELLAGNGWKAASKAAASELHLALREPTFDDAEKASRARDRAHVRAAQSWRDDDSGGERAEAQPQPHGAEFLAENESDSTLAPRVLIYTRAKRGMLAVVAYWRASESNYASEGLRRDLRAIRAHALAVLDDTPQAQMRAADRAADREANGAYMAAYRLGKRVEAGAESLAKAQQTPAPAPQRTTRRAAPALMTLPHGRAEHFADDYRTRSLPALALRLLDRAPAESLASLAEWRPGMTALAH